MQKQQVQGVPGTCPDIELVDGGLAVDDLTVIRKGVVMMAMEEEMVAAAVEFDLGEMAKGLTLLEKYLHPLAWRKSATTCKGLLKTNE